ncbi:MAG: YHS domain-containing protein [Patiriisocius sp.]|jgi:YHS domain-containing protein
MSYIMKKILIVLFVALGYAVNAQTIDYNTDNGFIAEGYDVVSYFDNSATEGNKKYVATHDGIKYKFSTQGNLNLFNENPTKYTPQFGGYCAYALATKGKKVTSNPETFEIRDGKLYLFYNSWGGNTLVSWLAESPDTLAIKATNNWEKVKQRD